MLSVRVQVQSFLLHFWQGMPAHIQPILSSHVIISLIGVCDSILYKAILDVLMPSILQPLPDRCAMLHRVVLYCAVLCCVALCCTVLHCTMLCCVNCQVALCCFQRRVYATQHCCCGGRSAIGGRKTNDHKYHRLNGSSSPVLTATHLSYGRLCDFLGFFPRTDLEVTPLDRY